MKLSMKEVAYIGRMYENLSEISLLSTLQELEDGSELFSLMEKEIIVEDELAPSVRAIMDVVANAQRSTRLFVKDRLCMIEKYTYRYNDHLVLIENDEGQMLFSRISDLDGVAEEIAELIGSSNMKTAAFEKIMSHNELLVFLSIVDLYRTKGLKAYIGELVPLALISEEEIVTQMETGTGNSLAQMLIQNYEMKIPMGENLKLALEGLVEKGCLERSKEVLYCLTEEYELFAKGFLIPETLLTLESLGYGPTGELVSASSLCIGAGQRDFLFITFGNEDVEIATLTGNEMLHLMENYMLCPSLLVM